ncbi:MAG TPA: RnfH family protein [Steroidobacteraceae bacterium]|nr:RnfH family protein [Steroidobacteraceae bacterium]
MAAEPLNVEVIYALPDGAVAKAYRLTPPATVADALALAAADPDFQGIDVNGSEAGIFGHVVPRSRALQDGDRIELYRPLAIDPKEARRQRVKRARASRLPAARIRSTR